MPSLLPFRSRFFPFLALVAMLALTAGCGVFGRKKPAETGPDSVLPPRPDYLLAEGTLDELKAVLDQRTRSHQTMQAVGRIVMEQEGMDGKIWFDANLLHRTPDDIRLRGSRVPVGTIFEVLTLQDSACVYLNREKELFVGTLQELQELGGVTGLLTPRQMLSALLINHDLKRRLEVRSEWMFGVNEETMLLSQEIPGSERVMSWAIRREDAAVTSVAIQQPNGVPDLIVEYEDYEFIDAGELMPMELTVLLPQSAAKVSVKLSKYRMDPPLVDAVFQCPDGKAEAIYPLEELANRQALEPDANYTDEGAPAAP